MNVNSKGSGETALVCRLARAFSGRLCDKYPFLMCWLIYEQHHSMYDTAEHLISIMHIIA